jgi:SAM-dependent methyltransferase
MNAAIDALLREYANKEPAGTDAWNPLCSDIEVWHRMRLFAETVAAIRKITNDPTKIRVLDVGCGVGRSSRLLVELGVLPQNIVGLDLRAEAINYARHMNPAIKFEAITSLEDWPRDCFDLCMQCTAFSSIADIELRRATARVMEESVGDRGYIFWWDLLRANKTAGGDILNPAELFNQRQVLLWTEVPVTPTLNESFISLRRGAGLARKILGRLPVKKTHLSALFGAKSACQ